VTDKEKILGIWELFNCEVEEAPGSVRAVGKRFFFGADGSIEKITFKDSKGNRYTATEQGVSS
jgi:hypothetical protein